MSNLIIQTAFLGDLLLSIPLIRALRECYPKQPIELLARKGLGSFLEKLAIVDKAYEVDKKDKHSIKQVTKEIQKNKYQVVLCPHQSLRSALLVCSLKAENKISFQSWWNLLFFNIRVKKPMNLPEALRQQSLISALDDSYNNKIDLLNHNFLFQNSNTLHDINKNISIPSWASMSIKKEVQALSYNLDDYKGMCFISPGSVWPTKRWTKSGFISVGQSLIETGEKVCILGAPDEYDLCESISKSIPHSINLCGKTSLLESLFIMSQGKVLITNDSGAQHMAAAVELPVVSVFGPTTLDLGFRSWQQKLRVAQLDLDCRPCGKHGHNSCPLGTHACMKNLPAELVLSKIDELELM